jgi:ubiquinone/menaquinone biosynthesis C-methylase UbiE
VSKKQAEGWQGWDTYAPFYDWENAQTLGRRDVSFWQRVASEAKGPVLELGCGTGRVSIPLAKSGVNLIGIDRSQPMLDRATARIRKSKVQKSQIRQQIRKSSHPQILKSSGSPLLLRGDIRYLPFEILQSLTRPRDLTAALESVARVLCPGGVFGVDLVPDVPKWREYSNRVQMRGRVRGAKLTLIESVSQDAKRRLTRFEQTYVEQRGTVTRKHRFDLTFRTLSVPQMTRQLERAGFVVDAVLGDYRGRPWDDRADVWIIMARRALW